MILNKVTIVGAGLIGSSIGRGLAEHVGSIHYIDHDRGSDTDFKDADLIVIATPVLTIPEIFKRAKSYLTEHTLLMDVGSTKTFVLEQAKIILAEHYSNFVGCHPIAGKETSGFAAGEASLFQNKPVILTPSADTAPEAFNTIKTLWTALGAEVTEMKAEAHDLAFAKYSHLANLLSFILKHQEEHSPQLSTRLQPPSFKDMTRLSASSRVMWWDICQSNHTAILEALSQFEQDFSRLKKAIEEKDKNIFLKF